jgi:S1-C subfamily serine protease
MSEVLSALSDALVAAVEQAGPSVVRVEARDRLPASGIAWSRDVVLTANHVLERDRDIRVGLADGRTLPAQLAGRDPGTDLAVLRVEAGGLQPMAWVKTDELWVGTLVLALGRPGKNALATLGILSSLDEGWRTRTGGWLERYMQTDAVMYPGFSGGPLVDAEGRVLGLNTSALVQGLSLTVPEATVRQTVGTLLTQGRVRRAYLGIGVQPVQLAEVLQQQIGQAAGLLVMQVDRGGPADKSGLLLGDTLVKLDGKPLQTLEVLLASLNGNHIGGLVPLQIVRAGRLRDLAVTAAERPA